jgi:HSP20 family protein
MFVRFDPFRDLDRLASEMVGAARTPAMMPMDCLRTANRWWSGSTCPASTPTRWTSRPRTTR